MLGGDLNPHLFLYPSLFMYATAGACAITVAIERVAGRATSPADFAARASTDPSAAIVVARALAAIAGVMTVAFVYLVAREWFAETAALAAAAICAVAFLHVRDSHFGVTDVPATLLTVAALWAALRCDTQGATWRRVAITGLLCGLAASTKYNTGLVALPAALVIVSAAGTRDWTRMAQSLALLGVAALVGFVAGTPYAVLDAPAFLHDLRDQQHIAMGVYHTTILDASRRVVGEHGWMHHLTFSLRYGLGIPVLAAAALGAVWLAAEQTRRAAILFSFPIAFYLAMGSSALAYARWMTPLVPFLCLAAGIGVERLAAFAADVVKVRHARVAVAAALTVLVSATTAGRAIAFDRLIARTDTRVLGAHWIESNYPSGATLYQTGKSYGYLEPRPAARYAELWFDDHWGVFAEHRGAPPASPDLVVVLDSPLDVYSAIPARLPTVLDQRYELAATFSGIADADGSTVYDQQDAFYVPYAGVTAVHRPGPTVRIFERRTR
jgi:hypothetical protein